jgi:hypothetical protein
MYYVLRIAYYVLRIAHPCFHPLASPLPGLAVAPQRGVSTATVLFFYGCMPCGASANHNGTECLCSCMLQGKQ